MRRMYEYGCHECGWYGDLLLVSPAPDTTECRHCGAQAKRKFAIRGLMRSGRDLAAIAPAAGSVDCKDNPDVPGLCHIAPGARRAAIAAHRGDETTLSSERAKQKRKFEQSGPPKLSDVVHSH
jgi:hypothetical protein